MYDLQSVVRFLCQRVSEEVQLVQKSEFGLQKSEKLV